MMKKTILKTVMAMSIIFSTACKNKTKTSSNEDDNATQTEETAAESKGQAKIVATVPSFDNDDVQQYITAYEDYIEKYKNAVENKDMTAFAALGTKGQELASMGQEITSKLSMEEVKKYTDYMTAKAEELQDLSAKITQ